MERNFESKQREYDCIKFAGIQIEKSEDGYLMHQEGYAMCLKLLTLDCTFKEFRPRRHELVWLKHTTPDICAAVNILAQVTESRFERMHVKQTNRIIAGVQAVARRGITQQRLDRSTLRLKVFTDSSFANAEGNKSQLGFIVLLLDAIGKCNMLHFASYKSQRVVRSMLGGETYAFADGFDFAYPMRHGMQRHIEDEDSA